MSINVCNDRSMASITSLPSGVSGSSLVLLSEQTASSSATISFTSGIDSTYKEYIFKFISCHPATDNVDFLVNFSADGGSNYNVTKTTTFFAAYENESGGSGTLTYADANDLAQSTDFQMLNDGVGNGNDETCVGTLHLFDPSNTTFVKHFMATSHRYYYSDYAIVDYMAGYCNTTSAVNAVQFKFQSGNIDAGTIKMYGVV
jgi:hypothetical protein